MRIAIPILALMVLLPAAAFGQTVMVDVDGMEHTISYEGDGVVISSANVDLELNSIELNLDVTGDPGTLTLNLDRGLLSGIHNGADERFDVIVDTTDNPSFEQAATETGKSLTLQLDAGTEIVDILLDPIDAAGQPVPVEPSGGLSGTIQIGALLPLTGDFSVHARQNELALRHAEDEFNNYLLESGEPWNIELLIADTTGSPDTALAEAQAFHEQGVNFIIGPETSASITRMQEYIASNDIMLVSCCSTSPTLSIPGDSIYRLIPDDTSQAVALADVVTADGIAAVLPVWRDDVWGNAWASGIRESFSQEVDQGVRYPVGTTDFAEYTQMLAEQAQSYADQYGPERVGVIFLGFDEVLPFIQSSANHDILGSLRWYGTDANTKDIRLTEDPVARDFIRDTCFVAMLQARHDNPQSAVLDRLIQDETGSSPTTYVYSSYDTLWAIGLAIQEAQSAEAQAVEQVLPAVVDQYSGASGDIQLNAAGDLDASVSEIWNIKDDQWVAIGTYDFASDSPITWSSEGATSSMAEPEEPAAPEPAAPDDAVEPAVPDDVVTPEPVDTVEPAVPDDTTVPEPEEPAIPEPAAPDDAVEPAVPDDAMTPEPADTVEPDDGLSDSDQSQTFGGWQRDLAIGAAAAFIVAFVGAILLWLISRASRRRD